ncbi:hypothetical protein N4R57_16400 [Rhodobacteraceae bacterium D3-12]|nr:hypothetical protein N4R57_16400 [Rhodobacteraceae bacterium D3-12]
MALLPANQVRPKFSTTLVCMGVSRTFSQFGCANSWKFEDLKAKPMARAGIEQKALELLRTFERAGKSVSRVSVDGRKIELFLVEEKESDEFERIDMRHGKT